jgi:glyoxylase-like metal-dependent hydrolase (beta-lactamase superfamily II)
MLYLRQLLSGRDFAQSNEAAAQMANFVYLLGDRDAGECFVVDPAWDVRGLIEVAASHGLRITGAIATHGHADHIGGNLWGNEVEGAARLVELAGIKLWCHEREAERIVASGRLRREDLVVTRDDDVLRIGAIEVRFLHTPGHTPGAQCLLVEGNLLTGDTLFVGECGRVDLPGSDPDLMFESLRRLAALPSDTVVLPGHDYGATPRSTIAEERRSNPCLQPRTLEEWQQFVR